MQDITKITSIKDEIESQFVDRLLTENNIPHIMRSYHDLAFDGIFQTAIWGHVEAPEEYREQVMSLINDIRSEKIE
jgi:hypothetical protein